MFLFDVDNTLLNNDGVTANLKRHLEKEVGRLSDGDVVFQPRKVERSGLFEAVNGKVLIYVHKEMELDDVTKRFPADHYVMVDDKLRILTAIKKIWGRRVTTVFVRQGHCALDQKILAAYPAPDVSIDSIGALLNYDLQNFVPRAAQVDCGIV